MSKTGMWAGVIVVVLVLGGIAWYATQGSPSAPDSTLPPQDGGSVAQNTQNAPGAQGTAGSQQTQSSGSSAPSGGATGASIDSAASSIVSGYQAEATQANSENGTEGATQLNSSVDNQAVYAQ